MREFASDAPQEESAAVRGPLLAVRRIAAAAALYFALVFAVGLLLGPVRVFYLEPALGATIAVLCEAPFLVLAMWAAARIAPRAAAMRGAWPAYLAMGGLALLFQQIADLAAGFWLRGLTLDQQFAYFGTPPGYVYAASLALFALMPAMIRLGDARARRVR
ncbi:MAG: hypothetical protein AB7O04_12010 [Hyphomonadaceae bacterium]